MGRITAQNNHTGTLYPVDSKAIRRVIYEVVAVLPAENIKTSVIYCVPIVGKENEYDMYLYIDGAWVPVGSGSIEGSGVFVITAETVPESVNWSDSIPNSYAGQTGRVNEINFYLEYFWKLDSIQQNAGDSNLYYWNRLTMPSVVSISPGTEYQLHYGKPFTLSDRSAFGIKIAPAGQGGHITAYSTLQTDRLLNEKENFIERNSIPLGYASTNNVFQSSYLGFNNSVLISCSGSIPVSGNPNSKAKYRYQWSRPSVVFINGQPVEREDPYERDNGFDINTFFAGDVIYSDDGIYACTNCMGMIDSTTSKPYYSYTWEKVAYSKTETDTLLSTKESTSNKVTSLSSSSTDNQYPSAKCVYDMIGNIEALLSQV